MVEALLSGFGPTAAVWVFGALVFLSVASLGVAIGYGVQASGVSKGRLGALGLGETKKVGKAGPDRRKEIQEQIKKQEERRRDSTKASMAVMMERAGMSGTPMRLHMICAIIGCAVAGGLSFGVGLSLLYTVAVVPVFAFLLPKKIVSFHTKRQQKKFVTYFPDAIDILVRGVKTGLPVNEGMRLVGREMPAPVSTEFRNITDATSVGVTFGDALDRMYARMPLSEVNFFNIVLTIQKETGGNLSEALGNLSKTLRDRKKLVLKIQALSSEAKASAMIIGVLPFLLGLVLYSVAPDYLGRLFTDSFGQMMVAGGLTWMGIGVYVMKMMIDIDI